MKALVAWFDYWVIPFLPLAGVLYVAWFLAQMTFRVDQLKRERAYNNDHCGCCIQKVCDEEVKDVR